jgi:hypothetical protein
MRFMILFLYHMGKRGRRPERDEESFLIQTGKREVGLWIFAIYNIS